MNRQELGAYLQRITPHEQAYRDGIINDYKAILSSKYKNSTKNINGKEVLFFDLNKLNSSTSKGSLFVRKHSRFQVFPEHCHGEVEINYIYSGSCRQVIKGVYYDLKEGQTLLLDADTVHTIAPLGEEDILINLNIDKDYLSTNFFNRFSSESIVTRFFLNAITEGVSHDNFLIFSSENSQRLRTFIEEFLCEWLSPSLVSDDILNSLLSLILLEMINVYKKSLTKQKDYLEKNPVLSILHYIENHYQICTLKETARFFNLNANYLSNLLKKHTGFNYRELVIQQRISTAKHLLRDSNLSVTDIAAQVGYSNTTFFYEKFSEAVGSLPGEYRLQFRFNTK